MEVKKFDEDAVKKRYEEEYNKEPSPWLSKDVSFWWYQLNPFRGVSVESIKKASFIEKLDNVFLVFFGAQEMQEEAVPGKPNEKKRVPKDPEPYMEKNAGISGAWNFFRQYCLIWDKPGILDYCLLFLPQLIFTCISITWVDVQVPEEKPSVNEQAEQRENTPTEDQPENQPSEEGKYKFWIKLVGLVALTVLPLLLKIGTFIVSFALVLALSPVVLIVHVFLGPKEKDGSTPLRQSVFFNPSTWILGSILLAAIGLLIQGLNPAVFAQAAVTMGIMQTVLLGMAAVTLVGGLLYTIGYAAYERFKRVEDVQVHEKDQLNSVNPGADVYPNPLKYLSERWKTISNNPRVFLLIWGIGLSVLAAVMGLTLNYYFTGGMFIHSLMGPLFDFMNQAFFAIVHALAGLSGLGFLSGISGSTLVLVGHILSAVLLSAAAFFITDNVSRMVETIVPKAPSPEEEITFDNPAKGTSSEVTKENNQPEHYDPLLTQSVKEAPKPYTTDRDMFWCCALGGRKIFSVTEACDSETPASGKIHLEVGTYVYIHPGRLSSSDITGGLIRGTEKIGGTEKIEEIEKTCQIESNNLAEVPMPANYLVDCEKKRAGIKTS